MNKTKQTQEQQDENSTPSHAKCKSTNGNHEKTQFCTLASVRMNPQENAWWIYMMYVGAFWVFT